MSTTEDQVDWHEVDGEIVEPPAPFPVNRIVAFLGPFVAVIAGGLADWLLVHVHFLSTFHVEAGTLANTITQLVIFVVTAGLIWLGQHKWLDGWSKWERAVATNAPGYVPGPFQPVPFPVDEGPGPEPESGPVPEGALDTGTPES